MLPLATGNDFARARGIPNQRTRRWSSARAEHEKPLPRRLWPDVLAIEDVPPLRMFGAALPAAEDHANGPRRSRAARREDQGDLPAILSAWRSTASSRGRVRVSSKWSREPFVWSPLASCSQRVRVQSRRPDRIGLGGNTRSCKHPAASATAAEAPSPTAAPAPPATTLRRAGAPSTGKLRAAVARERQITRGRACPADRRVATDQ